VNAKAPRTILSLLLFHSLISGIILGASLYQMAPDMARVTGSGLEMGSNQVQSGALSLFIILMASLAVVLVPSPARPPLVVIGTAAPRGAILQESDHKLLSARYSALIIRPVLGAAGPGRPSGRG